jgi:hypothetical protein
VPEDFMKITIALAIMLSSLTAQAIDLPQQSGANAQECFEKLISDMTYQHSRMWDDGEYNQIQKFRKLGESNTYAFVLSNGKKDLLGLLVADFKDGKCTVANFGEEDAFFGLADNGEYKILLTPGNYENFCALNHCS